MSGFKRFMKANKRLKENTTYAATKSLTDESGNPLLWVIKPLTARENDEIRDACTYDVQVLGKPNIYTQKLNTSRYLAKMASSCVVEPNLYDKELQDSYGVYTPEDLIREMIDDPGEYQKFLLFIQDFNGFTPLDERVAEAKN